MEVAKGPWELVDDHHEKMSEMGIEIECLEVDICQSKVSFQQIVDVKTLLCVADILLKHSYSSNHAKALLECAQLLLESIPSCIELGVKYRGCSMLSQCYHLAGATVSQKQVLNKGLELTAPSVERMDGLEASSRTSIFAVRRNDDVFFGADSRSVSWFYGRVVKGESIKAYTLYKDVFVLGSGHVRSTLDVIDDMRAFAKQKTFRDVKEFAQKMAEFANKAKLYGEKSCGFIVIGRLDIHSAAKIYLVKCRMKNGAMKYDACVSDGAHQGSAQNMAPGPSQIEYGSMSEASGSGAPFMHNYIDWPHVIEHLKMLRTNKNAKNDDKSAMEYVRDVIAEARCWDYGTDGALLIVALCRGKEAKYHTAHPSDENNSFSGYGQLEETKKRPFYVEEAEKEAAERGTKRKRRRRRGTKS